MEIPCDFFLNTPGNTTSFLIDYWNFPGFFSILLEIPCLQPPFGFFMEQPIVVETRAKTAASLFVIIKKKRIGSYFLPAWLRMQCSGPSFCIFYEVIISCYPNFMTCFYFPLALVRSNSIHCHTMDLFMSKENLKKEVYSDNNWKTEWF